MAQLSALAAMAVSGAALYARTQLCHRYPWVRVSTINSQECCSAVRATDAETPKLKIILHYRLLLSFILGGMFLLAPLIGRAEMVSTDRIYDERLRGSRNYSTLDESVFGDQINLQDGSVTFTQDDVLVDTNGALKLRIGRKSPNMVQGSDDSYSVFGRDWDLNVPYMTGRYDARDGWNAGNQNGQRCSAGRLAPSERNGPWPYYHQQVVYASMYWQGININIPGSGEEKLLQNSANQINPTDGKFYPGTTKSLWKIACLGAIKNGPGEGFSVATPDGSIYFFDWIATRNANDLTDNGATDLEGNGTDPWHLLAPLTDVFLYATRVVDRFGNSITYTYDADAPNRLTAITSSDGARIDVGYNAEGKISTVTTAGKVWTYGYLKDSQGTRLSYIRLPDKSEWAFSHRYPTTWVSDPAATGFWSDGCKQDPGRMTSATSIDPSEGSILTMTHPSGSVGEFRFRGLYHGTNNTPGGCGLFGSYQTSLWWGTYGVPSAYIARSLYQKILTGPGVAKKTWDYMYYPSWSFASQCSSGCATTSQTTVQANGVLRRYTFGNSYAFNLGQLLSETVEKNGLTIANKTYAFLTSSIGQPFPDDVGNIPKAGGNIDLYGNPFQFKSRPLSKVTYSLDGVSFVKTTSAFDSFARPIVVVGSNSLGHSKTDTIEYHDALSQWVLGQVKRSSTNGIEVERTDYDANALPWKHYSFSKLQHTFTYRADGMLTTVKDGKNNVIVLSNWKRGIPQTVAYPDGTTQSASVNDSGWITSVVDENGFATGYGYDAMGRLAGIAYPLENGVKAWNATTEVFEPVEITEYGIPAGHWRRTVSTGTSRRVTYFDALWRPLVEEAYDAANTAATRSVRVMRYDPDGRLAFQSYPRASLTSYADPTLTGTRTTYDALGRVIRIEEDSELGVLATTTQYLSGFKTEVTNPRGFKTTTSYLAYGQPATNWPVAITHPEGAHTDITRDVFGKATSVIRRNSGSGISAQRRYFYNGYQQLCRVIEPETGGNLMGYDAAGNLAWSASGLSASAACNSAGDTAEILARKVVRNYDTRNRLTTLRFPDGNGNQTWIYTPDGLPQQIVTANDNGSTQAINHYTYNHRRLLVGESLEQPGWYSWGIGYGYDGNGNLAGQSYPTGLYIDYAPNALGQATRAGTYAQKVTYHPNGGIAQFTYGNGIVHTMTQNVRQLPGRSTDSGGALDHEYQYDPSANVTYIGDLAQGSSYSRWMSYDGLDRLTAAGSASFGGDHWHRFTYDALDNLKSWKLAGVKDYANYYYEPGTNRLTNIQSSAGATVVGLGYDVQGNLANKNGQAYTFDYGNRLRAANNKEYYRYDGQGRRVLNWRPSVPLSLSQYSLSGQAIHILDYSKSKSFDHIYLAGSLVAIREYSHANWAVQAVKYQHTDALGSPVAVSDETAKVIDRTQYEPYGAAINKPAYDGIGYTGHVQDGATGLTYMQQRYYDPGMGRFLSVDPVTGNTGANFNRYKYAANNPYRFTDPDGRQEKNASKCGGGNNPCLAIIPNIERKPMPIVNAIVVHRTAGSTAAGAIATWKSPSNKQNIGAHFIIDNDGKTTQTASTSMTTNHVGQIRARNPESNKAGLSKSAINSVEQSKAYPARYPTNNDSIGIEVVGAFNPDTEQFSQATPTQLNSLGSLIQSLQKKFDLTNDDVYRHGDIAYKMASEGAGLGYDP